MMSPVDVLLADPTMDPKKAECVGFYLYGSGYFAREDQQAAILMGRRVEASFCSECPLQARCIEKHRERTRGALPEDWEKYTALVQRARRRGVSEELVEAALMKAGKPGPLMRVALDNYQTGVRHRRQSSGAALRSSAQPTGR